MRLTALLLLSTAGLFSTATAIADRYAPFLDSLFGLSNDALLIKRQNNCQSGYINCGNLGASDVCCSQGSNCALDQAGNIACCPSGAVCTGTIRGTRTDSVTSGSASGTNAASSTTAFVLGGTTTSTTSQGTTAQPTGVAGGGSTVPNNFFPFIYIPTSYANAALCTSAFSSCQTASTSCFVALAGQNGVTVSGFGGGITVQGASGTILSTASSICSSLSAEGCYNLQESQCAGFGTGAGSNPTGSGTTTGFVQVGNHGPRQTACPGILYAAGAGAMVGAVGGLL
ncbi:uncharacterized protein A1O9_11213 [Exophiala aquamarina CBS 119918]|uniref:Hydrophobin n=1 Tax=Exophiala aquamarina CBS 119918 TaxID=1182545 RepID=A0A072NZ11_9EURO|nr:uncharacterized protein A1O9_11213 [Exophiala aquamarina CBS 119918]KEF52796.1 hypothetical protein A1O9_11213 [Exophiala aquamarina CBS 119918]